MSNGQIPDPDDFFAETRMTFGDHIEDLRTHLWRAIAGFGLALFLSFFIGQYVVDWITAPVKQELHEFYKRRVEKTMKDLASSPALQKVNQPTGFTRISFDKKQFLAAVRGESAEAVNAFPRPAMQGDDKNKPAEGEDALAPDEIYQLWIAHDEPLKEMGLLQEALRIVGDFDTMSTLNIMEAFMVWFKVCIVCGLVIGSPWIFWQIWAFVAAGLYPHEKRYVHVYLPVSLGLFLAGVILCELFVIPRAIEALLWFNEWLGLKPDLRLNEWLSFAILLPLVFGLSFQTPLVMLFLAKLGIMDVESFRRKRRYAWFAMAVFAAIITPTPDALTMLFMWVPMCLLFELGIVLIKMSPRPQFEADVPDSEEMIEV
jgi:sec-independent protein translocase protein TatC